MVVCDYIYSFNYMIIIIIIIIIIVICHPYAGYLKLRTRNKLCL